MSHPSVIVVGAGVGGLCLAQGLKASGNPVRVFERDPSRATPVEGYRLSISATGSRALKTCLPKKVFDMLTMRTSEPSQRVTFLDHKLNRLLTIDLPHRDRRSDEAERPVSRTTLRRVLLEGLDDVVNFGKTFVSFEDEPDGRVTAVFGDGSRETADLLVGADGANSRVRSQLLPDAKRLETGIVAIGGKVALNDYDRFSEILLRGPTPILGPRGCFLFVSAVTYDDLGDPGHVDGAEADERENYLMWGFSARRERLGISHDFERLEGDGLKRLVERLTTEWHPDLKHVLAATKPAATKSFAVKTSTEMRPWRTRNVTLLGDALHNMPPYRGVGANSALWDAALLYRALSAENPDD
jgi:2-polyprenyl-6-methoxyphenol hydroxylase-like FAD-dependent oxidoreductase